MGYCISNGWRVRMRELRDLAWLLHVKIFLNTWKFVPFDMAHSALFNLVGNTGSWVLTFRRPSAGGCGERPVTNWLKQWDSVLVMPANPLGYPHSYCISTDTAGSARAELAWLAAEQDTCLGCSAAIKGFNGSRGLINSDPYRHIGFLHSQNCN